ncbi:MAG: isocitrate lyase/PEP mutase family protein [Alphaproteobacteria bacterium]|nr:isocitrate lyase/PEP mutase family protein [Alphaproteobacteria bacterium]
MTSRARRFRELLEAPDILVAPGVYDGFSTRLVEQAGFKAATVSGAGVSESNLGWADKGIMGFQENLRACRSLAACTDLPLRADADTGYGNAVNVHFTVRGFEDAGLAAVMIEDQVWPKRCGHLQGKDVIPAAEMVQKIKAACDARRDPDFVIMARTDAAGVTGVDDAIERLNLYAEAGADALYADALLSAGDIARVAAGVPRPYVCNMGFGLQPRSTTPLLTAKQLQDMGVAMVTYPRMLTSAAVHGMLTALAAFQEGAYADAPVPRPELQVSFEQLSELMGLPALDAMEEKYTAARD